MRWLRKLRALFRKEKLDAEMSEEMRVHLELQEKENIARGMAPSSARHAAQRSFGGLEQIKERVRDQRGWVGLEQLGGDLRFAFRQLGKSPGITAVAVLSLALGIGANTTVFSLVKAVLLQTLPVRNPEELVVLSWAAPENVTPSGLSGWRQRDPKTGLATSTSFSRYTFEQLRDRASSLTDIFAFEPMGGIHVIIDGTTEIVPQGQYISGEYHQALGVRAAVGRLIAPADNSLEAHPVAVISAAFWQRRFAGDTSVVGKTISIYGVPLTIVGVTAPGFKGTAQVGDNCDISIPLAVANRIKGRRERGLEPGMWWLRIMGRLKPGVTAAGAQANLEVLFHQSARGNVSENMGPGVPRADPDKLKLPVLRVDPGGQGLYEARRQIQRSLNLLVVIVGIVLLVACANIANLLLARAMVRRREIALRLALGASRRRIVGQLLMESLLLATLGTMGGLLFALWGTPAILAMQPFGHGAMDLDVSFDWRVLGFTAAAAITTAMVFGLVPALRATQLNLTTEFQGGPRMLGGRSRSGLAQSLMVAQVALSLVLLVGAGLFLRTLRNLQHVEVGFNKTGLLLFAVDAAPNGATYPQAVGLYERIRERLLRMPGVQRVTYARMPLLSYGSWTSSLRVPGYVPKAFRGVNANGIDPEFLPALEIPLVRGRNFSMADAEGAPKVAIVDEAFAQEYFGGADPIGRRINLRSDDNFDTEIVGVVRNLRYDDVRGSLSPTVMVPYAQTVESRAMSANFMVRFSGNDGVLAAAVTKAIREIDPNLPVMDLRTQEQQIERLFTQERVFAKLCSFFGALALALSAVGLYGLFSYFVLRRTGEIGVRMALGALPGGVLRMILRESLALVILGVLIGIAAAVVLSKGISSMLFGLSPTDPLTYLAAGLLLVTVASLASLIPARRAAKIDPMVALRCE